MLKGLGDGKSKKTFEQYKLDNSSKEELLEMSKEIDSRLFGLPDTSKEAKKITLAGDLWDGAKKISENYGTYQGLHVGYKAVENVMGSFLPGELMVLAGPPGKGKSLFAQNIMFNVVQQGKAVAFISLEMLPTQALSRMQLMCDTEEQEDNLRGLLWFQQKVDMTADDVATFMAEASEQGAELVVIDYLQFIPRSTGNERGEIAQFVKRFKKQADKYGIPVILISSINRAVEAGAKPDLKNLAETSVIEFTADMVCFIWRQDDSDVIEFYLRKNRSRKNIFDSVHLLQEGWKLSETSTFIDPWKDMK